MEKNRPGRFNRQKALELGVPEGPLFTRLHRGEDVELNGKKIKCNDVVGPSRRERKIVYSGDTRPKCKDSDIFFEVKSAEEMDYNDCFDVMNPPPANTHPGYEIVENAKKKLNGHSKRFKYIMSHRNGKIEIMGIMDDYIYFKYHQAKVPANIGKFFKRKLIKPQDG